MWSCATAWISWALYKEVMMHYLHIFSFVNLTQWNNGFSQLISIPCPSINKLLLEIDYLINILGSKSLARPLDNRDFVTLVPWWTLFYVNGLFYVWLVILMSHPTKNIVESRKSNLLFTIINWCWSCNVMSPSTF